MATAKGRIVARWLWDGLGGMHAPGELCWDDRGVVTFVGPRHRAAGRGDRDAVVDAIVPGLVNAHAHLQLGPLPWRKREPFVDWIHRVVEQRGADRAGAEAPAAERARIHLNMLWRDGCTAVGEIDSTGVSPAALRQVPLAGRCYQEVLGFDLPDDDARALVEKRLVPGTTPCPAGLSPHAPYSTSPGVFREVHRRGLPQTIHVAETPEEQELLLRGSGPFFDLLCGLGRIPPRWQAPGVGAVEYLDGLGVLGPTTSLVHCGHLMPGDVERIARSGAAIVVCPGTLAWFDREPPPVPEWIAAGIPVALGTDSRASNQQWSMRAEMAAARRMWPTLAPEAVLAMVSASGARALALRTAGRLQLGGRADFAVLEGAGGAAAVLDEWAAGAAVPTDVYLAGTPCVPEGFRDRDPPGPNVAPD